MRKSGNTSQQSLLLPCSESLTVSAASSTQKYSSVLLARLARPGSTRHLRTEITTAIYGSPVVFKTATLIKKQKAGVKLRTGESKTKVSKFHLIPPSCDRFQLHRKTVSGVVMRKNSMETEVSADSLYFREKVQDLLSDLSSRFTVPLPSSLSPPCKTVLRRHRDIIIAKRQTRFSAGILKRAVFEAWKSTLV